MEIIKFLAISCGILVVMFGGGWLISSLLDKIEFMIEDRRAKKHPELLELMDEYQKLRRDISNIKKYIDVYKKNIDTLESNMKYYSDTVKAEKECTIVNYRERICELYLELEHLYEAEKEVCGKIREYIKVNNITWAPEWEFRGF